MRALSCKEAMEELKRDRQLCNAVVSETLRISGYDFGGDALFFDGVLIKGDIIIENDEFACLSVGNTIVTGMMKLRRVRLLNGMSIGAIINTELSLTSVEIGGVIDLTGLYTLAIAVEDMEELEEAIHWAAPTIPLIIKRPPLGLAML